ncbi:hypothetical protein Y013_25925 (plasmid) [Rhodococcus pyridinivorans SB3094]|uniref:Uncharacterized protein n=1 Tax=Rhodococcus pyridinivorans SB3094 TaxID=1435356 RepID=V9XL21_9NOCA|nr:hypothetical protein [Rhodococcus pyridinivorans]AHD24151.1 hypothetical protein Y013_25925 [Rhodococcus pyridinivorans SB3094]
MLALAVGGFAMIATYVASWPQSQFTSCEIDPASDPAACTESLLDQGGAGYVAAMMVPAVLCTVPALIPRRNGAWATVAALITAAIIAFATVGGVAMMCIATQVVEVLLIGDHSRMKSEADTPYPT